MSVHILAYEHLKRGFPPPCSMAVNFHTKSLLGQIGHTKIRKRMHGHGKNTDAGIGDTFNQPLRIKNKNRTINNKQIASFQ